MSWLGEETRGLAPDGSAVVSVSAVATVSEDDGPGCRRVPTCRIVVRESLNGATLRVLFDGRFLPSTTSRLDGTASASADDGIPGTSVDAVRDTALRRDAGLGRGRSTTRRTARRSCARNGNEAGGTVVGEYRQGTELIFEIPTGNDVSNSLSDERANVVGIAWIVACERGTLSGSEVDSQSTTQGDFSPVGLSVPLLLVPSVEVAAEINGAVAKIRATAGAIQANKLITDLGSCLTPFSANAVGVLRTLDILQTMGMLATRKMVVDLLTMWRSLDRQPFDDAASLVTAMQERMRTECTHHLYETGAAESDAESVEEVCSPGSSNVSGPQLGSANLWPALKDTLKVIDLSENDCEVDRMIKDDPELEYAWSELTGPLIRQCTPIGLLPLVVHWCKSRLECGIPDNAVQIAIAFNCLGLLSTHCAGFVAKCVSKKLQKSVTLMCFFLASVLMWTGYGIMTESIPHLSDVPGQCSKFKLRKIVFICIGIFQTLISLHVDLRKHLTKIHLCTLTSFFLPLLAGSAPSNDAFVIRLSKYEMLESAVANAATVSSPAILMGLDVTATVVFVVFVMYMLPLYIARKIQWNYLAFLAQKCSKEGYQAEAEMEEKKCAKVKAARNTQEVKVKAARNTQEVMRRRKSVMETNEVFLSV